MTSSVDLRVVGGLLALCLAIGGAGVSFPSLQLVLQLCSLAVAGYLIYTARDWHLPRLCWLSLGLLGAMFLLAILQLIPLPSSMWAALPGRELPVALDAALGVPQWRPLTLDVEGTLRSAIVLLPPAAVFAGSLVMPRAERVRLLWVVAVVSIFGAALGIIQVATGGSLTPYSSGHLGSSMGLFVNRNHNAALLLSAMPVAAALVAGQVLAGKPQKPWIATGVSAIIVLAVSVLATTSRMGLLLLPFALLASLALLFYRRIRWGILAIAAVAVGSLTTLLLVTNRFERTLSRFSGFDDSRLSYWSDLWWALDYYGLVGTGFGTFMPVYKSAESLETVGPPVTNHAHNDYLEILLEGGLPAALLLLGFLILISIAAYRSLRGVQRLSVAPASIASVIGIATLLASSLVDYPLRMPAISAVFALFCAILMPSARRRSYERDQILSPGKSQRILLPLFGWTITAALAVLVIQAGESARYLRLGKSEAALKWASWSTEAHQRLSTKALLRNDTSQAISHGSAAVALSPINAPAIRSIGLARIAEGKAAQGTGLMQIALALGWRDPLTQLWAIEAARVSGEPEKQVQRAEALFRQESLVSPASAQLLSANAGTLALLAQGLAQNPPWRWTFFKESGGLPADIAGAWLRLVSTLKTTKSPVSPVEGQPYLDVLVAAGKFDDAQRLWQLLQPRDELISNGDFEASDVRKGEDFPAYWQVPSRNRRSVTVAIPHFGSSRAVHIDAPEESLLLRQLLMLRPGTYQLSYKALTPGPKSGMLVWELKCRTTRIRQLADAEVEPSANWRQLNHLFQVPAEICPVQTLSLRTVGMVPVRGIWLDEIGVIREGR